MDRAAIERTLDNARQRLLGERTDAGVWGGELASSALSTAVAGAGLALRRSATGGASDMEAPFALIERAFEWLVRHQNDDGGWGDTTDSPSNISTTTLGWAAIGLVERDDAKFAEASERAAAWLTERAGGLTAQTLSRAICGVYGDDRTFSAPILTMCALTGRFGVGREAWRDVPALPFEAAVLPRRWFNRIGLPVVSYALPALIAIGQARHGHRPTLNPITRLLRGLAKNKTLNVLDTIQPASGGFLEAAPLTGFVLMSLSSIGRGDHAVARRAARFLIDSVRADGSWPIDVNLSTWVTTLSIGALDAGGRLGEHLSPEEREDLRRGLLERQQRDVHPYTLAAPGGWAWTDLPGGVPDGDDTPGALLALHALAERDEGGALSDRGALPAVEAGLGWLLDLRNNDGGVPTFCRGWGKLPFDRSSPDLTAHALRAWQAWGGDVSRDFQRRIQEATSKALRYLMNIQREDGAWIPLWFGNQHDPKFENPLYGTARVLLAAEASSVDKRQNADWGRAITRGIKWILDTQQGDGGWGGSADAPASIEETALAVDALAFVVRTGCDETDAAYAAAVRGAAWLVERTRGGEEFDPTPIGLYFARLWYWERLYPITFTVTALERLCNISRNAPVDGSSRD